MTPGPSPHHILNPANPYLHVFSLQSKHITQLTYIFHSIADTSKLRTLTAFCSGITGRNERTLVAVDQHAIDGQISVPRLDDVFLNTTSAIRATTITFNANRHRFALYSHDPGPLNSVVQILIFRKSVGSNALLVNLRPKDLRLLKLCVKGQVANKD